ncbi:P-loop containing nucleoside triphosphate hydrolase protein [Rhizopogon vinicolor AM-OR11-026]|uniref:p-loop containing nucleoside triphosphate hydrolase protein n=1 Tax=Rhizopogon vinicolor AM-OR11-026 TaxID=1314800 RepID=A0A1B7NC03_9AGAM|nr:P-loop containing nucleoside triphosphate hydrolase protein [Rhizopogon vinicolor AM-OR11-026]
MPHPLDGELLNTGDTYMMHSGLPSGDGQLVDESTSATYTTTSTNRDELTQNPAAADTTVGAPISADDQEVQKVCTIASSPINIIVFGDTGVGKSSVINMLMGEPVAAVSNQAVGCTYESTKYRATIAHQEVMLYDTAGLNEAEAGTDSPQQAIQNLRSLVEDIKTVNLLVYCIRGRRFRKIVADNYNMFCKTICGSKVPVVLVITGLENEDNMDDWWKENKVYFDHHKLEFRGHVCITTIRGRAFKDGLGPGYIFQNLYDVSKEKVRKPLADHAFGSSIPIVLPKYNQTPMRGASNSPSLVTLLFSLLRWFGDRWSLLRELYRHLTTADSPRREHRTERQYGG